MEVGKSIVLSKISEDEKKLVENQLETILASTYFLSAKQMQRFLEYIVKKTLSGQGDCLKQYTIGVEALNFPDDFDSDSNPSVRIMGGRVRNRLKEFYEDSNSYNKIIIDMPKGTYTPEFEYGDVHKHPSFDHNKETYLSTGPRLALITYSDKTEGKTSNRLLLQAADTLAEVFSHYILFKLIVANPYADKSESHTSGKELDADYVLALYVQELPNEKYKLICRFVKTRTEEIIWAASYELDKEIAIADQNKVIGRIAAGFVDINQGRLHLHWARSLLINKEKIPVQYKALVYFRQFCDDSDIKSLAEALTVFEEILTNNPNDIVANYLFAELCRLDFIYAYDLIDSSLERGIQCTEKVIHLRPDYIGGHFILGKLLFNKGEWERSADELRRAREISDSHAVVEYGCGYFSCLMGNWDEGLLLVKKAIALSNTYPSWYYMPIFLSLYTQGEYKEALVEAKKIVAPNIIEGPLARCISYAKLGDMVKAKLEYEKIVKITPNSNINLKEKLLRVFGNEELVEKIWSGLEIVIKD